MEAYSKGFALSLSITAELKSNRIASIVRGGGFIRTHVYGFLYNGPYLIKNKTKTNISNNNLTGI